MTAVLPKILLDTEFQDMNQYGKAVGWDLDFRQLETGKLAASVKAISLEKGMVLDVNFNRAFHQVGCAPETQMTFGIPGADVRNLNWCSRNVQGGSLLNFNLAGGFEGVSCAGFNGFTFAFDSGALQAFAAKLGMHEDLKTLVRGKSHWRSDSVITLSRRLRGLSQYLHSERDDVLRQCSTVLNEEVPTVLLSLLSEDSASRDISDSNSRKLLLKKSLGILQQADNLPIRVSDLCAQVGTSLSTLKRIFTDEFGMPPKAYIRARCLSACRDDLSKLPPDTVIADVANNWGFWHMGQFAADYRKMFGELPSHTLRRQ